MSHCCSRPEAVRKFGGRRFTVGNWSRKIRTRWSAVDAYDRATRLCLCHSSNHVNLSQRLQILKNAQATGGQLPAAPGPQDVHPMRALAPLSRCQD